MASSVNKVILLGHLGRDPEVRTSQDGTKIVNLNIATSETWKDRATGERKERTEWHKVVIFNPNLGDVAERYLRKGSPVYVEGALQTRKWTDKDGIEKYTTEVVISRFKGELTLLGGRDGGSGHDAPSRGGSSGNGGYGDTHGDGGGGGRPAGWAPPADLDDDIPF